MRWGSTTGTRVASRMSLDALDLAQLAMRRTNRSVDERERIAAADDHVAHIRVVSEIRERGLEPLERESAAARAHHAAPRAEAAVHGAAIGHEQQGAIGIAADQIRSDLVGLLAQRVAEIARRLDVLEGMRDDLTPDRAGGIVGIDEARDSKA